MKKIAKINCGNGDCTGKLSIYDNGSYKCVGKHNHIKDEGYITELRRKNLDSKIIILHELYGYSGWGLKITD